MRRHGQNCVTFPCFLRLPVPCSTATPRKTYHCDENAVCRMACFIGPTYFQKSHNISCSFGRSPSSSASIPILSPTSPPNWTKMQRHCLLWTTAGQAKEVGSDADVWLWGGLVLLTQIIDCQHFNNLRWIHWRCSWGNRPIWSTWSSSSRPPSPIMGWGGVTHRHAKTRWPWWYIGANFLEAVLIIDIFTLILNVLV